MSKFLCYIDILGFKNKIDEEDFEKCYQKIIKEIIEPFSYPDPDKVFLVSDSIVIISDNFQNIISNAFSIYSIAFKNGIFFRGL